MMQGMTVKSLKHHKALIPLYVAVGFAVAMATTFTIRTATLNPEHSWRKQQNPEPWNAYRDRSFKLMNPAGSDQKTCHAPKFD